MHTIKLNIDDTIYDKVMGLLERLPKDKIEVINEISYPSISFNEAKSKVQRAINDISKEEGISIEEAFSKICIS